jgi:hypothetical protein
MKWLLGLAKGYSLLNLVTWVIQTRIFKLFLFLALLTFLILIIANKCSDLFKRLTRKAKISIEVEGCKSDQVDMVRAEDQITEHIAKKLDERSDGGE